MQNIHEIKMKSRDEIREDFHEEANKVWSRYHYPEVEVRIRKRKSKDIPLMSIIAGHRDYRTKAVGNTLLFRSPKIILNVTDDSLQLSESDYRALLRHEALHMGYPRHDKDFKYMAKKVNAPFTEYAMYGGEPTLELQVKKGSRYKTIEKVPYTQYNLIDLKQKARNIIRETQQKVRLVSHE